MNVTCFYDQTPFTLGMEEKIAALRKMHAENLHHYDARCPRCGRANAISRERLEMFTPGWEEAIKAPAAAPMTTPKPAVPSTPAPPSMPPAPAPMPSTPAPMPAAPAPRPVVAATKPPAPVVAKPKKAAPPRRKHKPAAKKASRKAKPAAKKPAKKPVKKAVKKKAVRKAPKKTAKTRKRK
jgi:hypothetical protein